jgi:hypothetical protein
MAKLEQLEIRKAVSANPHITVRNKLLGLKQTVVYNPTQSKVNVTHKDFGSEEGHWIQEVLDAEPSELEKKVNFIGKLEGVDEGHTHLECCISEDHYFVAAQLFKYVDFKRVPVTDLKFFEGHDAQLVVSLF